jgi:hypothetical protein
VVENGKRYGAMLGAAILLRSAKVGTLPWCGHGGCVAGR